MAIEFFIALYIVGVGLAVSGVGDIFLPNDL